MRRRHAGQPHRRRAGRDRPRDDARRGRDHGRLGRLPEQPPGDDLAPNGDILTANANDGNIVETTPFGAEFQPANTGAGGLFGLTIAPERRGVLFVNDATNELGLLR